MIVWGGGNACQATCSQRSGGRFDPAAGANGTWSPMANLINAPASGCGSRAVWTGNRMIVFGGSSAGAIGDAGSYDPVTDTWAAIPTSGAPSARYHFAMAYTGSRVLVWGGAGTGSTFPNDGYYLDGTTWSPMTAATLPAGRSASAIAWTGTQFIVWGGTNGSPLATGSVFTPP